MSQIPMQEYAKVTYTSCDTEVVTTHELEFCRYYPLADAIASLLDCEHDHLRMITLIAEVLSQDANPDSIRHAHMQRLRKCVLWAIARYAPEQVDY